jgi:hypothetical protein
MQRLKENSDITGHTTSFDGSLSMFHSAEFSVLVSTYGVEFFVEVHKLS